MTFRYNRTPTGELPGNSMIAQTEAALSALVGEATEAKEAAQAAETAAEDAASAASAAASSAAASAAAAESAAQTAAVAQQALTIANRAEATAGQAVTTATGAVTAAQAAQTAAEDAASDAQDAADLAAQSAQDAQTAQVAASASQTAAESAQTSAGQAATIATQAQQAAAQSAQSAAQSAAIVAASARQIGEIVTSTLPLTTVGLHLLDGAVIDGNGIYAAFVEYVANLDQSANYFCTESEWQQAVTDFGVCGKFVYDSVNNTVRLPKLTGITEGTTDLTALGDLVEAGLPTITGSAKATGFNSTPAGENGALSWTRAANYVSAGTGSYPIGETLISIDASKSSSVYGNSTTVQPQTIKTLVYIVIANSVASSTPVDLDEIVEKALDAVTISEDQTITGVKTFSNSPLVPTLARFDQTQKVVNSAWAYGLACQGNALELTDLGTPDDLPWDEIDAGNFRNCPVGGYVTANSHRYYLAHHNYWLHTGDTECTTNHILVVPASSYLVRGQMNSTNTTAGGYVGSDFRTGNNGNTALSDLTAIINADWGASHILSHREIFTNAVTNGYPSGVASYDSTIDLMSEPMVFGCKIYEPIGNGSIVPNNATIDKQQIKLFAERPDLISNRVFWWLRGVVSDTAFEFVSYAGSPVNGNASANAGFRPAFGIVKSSS
jgi:hypothetical protein